MVSICFYFQVHQPLRLRKFSIFDIGNHEEIDYFESKEDRLNNEVIMKKVAKKCYLPSNKLMLELIKKHPEFKISYSISGIALEQFERYAPEVIDSFRELVNTGNVEILAETYYHSLAFLYSKEEFKSQVKKHGEKIYELFGVKPRVFRNTELIFNNELANAVQEMGYKGVLAEGADHILGWRSPNYVYSINGSDSINVLLKNYKLSDDIAFRFSEKNWSEWPLTAEKYSKWINSINGNGEIVNLFMDYETIGEHQWEETGIFDFISHLPSYLLSHPDNCFITPSEAVDKYTPVGELDVPYYVSWADVERDLGAWISNSMQHSALNKIYEIKDEIILSKDKELIDAWRKLQTSDHFYYMCTKWFNDGDVHKYFNPYESPYDAFITFMNVYQDLKKRIKSKKSAYFIDDKERFINKLNVSKKEGVK